MEKTKPVAMDELFKQVLGDKKDTYLLPPPSFEIMQCTILSYDEAQQSIVVKMPILREWLNPYKTMQGGMIMAAVDNAVGPLSLLVAPKNMTRNMESKLIKPITMDLEYIYVSAYLFEAKKKRLIFEAVVQDKENNIYAKVKVTNWIIE